MNWVDAKTLIRKCRKAWRTVRYAAGTGRWKAFKKELVPWPSVY